MNPEGLVWQIATIAIPMILAIVFHEVAHGWVARALGDPTAAEQKRLSLNPLRHVDPFGTIILPGLLKLSGAPVFGWAKPVPVDFRRLRNPRWGMVLVAAAGPLTNCVLAFVAAIGLGLLVVFAFLVILPYFWPELHLMQRLIGPPVEWIGQHLAGLAAFVAGPEPL
ncbi:site-2 protease family protein [Novosphingobium taihuense]|uniref:Zn-dependent protease n=1 Tax=Novosphingobium taihuense TaxID=260085 RepID=A0A7W7A8I0_9SPHN|nr:site-2 protease family protein [Novosphingobium taihuense]MBB4612343.1 Zn-dependent protease [Novosphingobium taihuense]TWH88304.1 hypothetical protein IQ25_00422 [Novosphingobium taihuense]